MLLATLWLPTAALSQTTDAVLVGIVTDASGAAIAGATVAATNDGTGVVRDGITNESGAYRIGPLVPGTYTVSTTLSGFKTKVQKDVVLQTGAVLKLDLALEVGDVSERVEVTAATPMLQTQEASVGGVVTTSEISRIPVNGRNYTRLLVLMPGSSDVRRSQGRGDLSGSQMVSINGQRTQDNNYTLDGVDNNMMFMNSPGGSPPMDSIQEFRVATGNSAEYGRSAGANVNISIKSGTRDLHGSAYEYLRNNIFDANDFFANRQGSGKVPFRQNQYGVAVGGPVVLPKLYNGRDKTFWFASWEGFRWRRGQVVQNTVPTANMRNGDFSELSAPIFDQRTGQQFPNNRIPENRIDPASKYLMDALMPIPNRGGLTNNFLQTAGEQRDRDMLVLRFDHSFSQNDVVFFRYLRQRVGQLVPGGSALFYSQNRYDVDNYAGGWTHIFDPTTVFEVKYGFNKPNNPGCPVFNSGLTREGILAGSGVSIFDTNALCGTLPNFAPAGYLAMGGGGGETILERDNQLNGRLSKMWGRHSLKMGGGYAYRGMDAQYANPTNGDMNFTVQQTQNPSINTSGNGFASFLLGFPNYVRRGFSVPALFARQHYNEAFFQDDWRVTDKLTVNMGIRWESGFRPTDTNNALGNLLVTRGSNGQLQAQLMWAGNNPLVDPVTGLAGQGPRTFGYGRSLMRSDFNNFAPRLGIAYQLTNRTVIRAGAGIFFNSTFMQEINDLRKFWPYLPQQELSLNQGGVLDFTLTNPGPGFGSTQAIGGWPQDPNNRTPYSQQWNLFIQHQLMGDTTVDIGYVGSANRKQIGYVGWNNAPTPAPGATADVNARRLLASSGFTGNMDGGSNRFNSEYHAMQLKITKRFAKGLSLLGNYTWGKCMDDQSSLAEGKYQDINNLRADWSRCSYDIRHAFKLGYVYDLPFGRGRQFGSNWNAFVNGVLGGWAVEGIVQMQTGTASNVRTGIDRANVGRTQERPNVIRNPNLSSDQRTVDRWFDTSAFEFQPFYTWGNAGAYIVNDDGRQVFDISIAKRFQFLERQYVEFRTEMFNFPNHPNFNAPGSGGYVLNTPTFGVITSATPSRQIQFVLRYAF